MKDNDKLLEMENKRESVFSELDRLIKDLLKEQNNNDGETIKILNAEKYSTILKSAKLLEALLFDNNIYGEIEFKIISFANAASLSIEVDELSVDMTKDFALVVEYADNFEIYPLTNGRMRLDLTYQSVLKEIIV